MSGVVITRRGFVLGSMASAALLTGWGGQAHAAQELEIIDCDGWGARPNSRIVKVASQRPVKIIVHHTATPNVDDLSRTAADRLARGIQNFHMDQRGWLDSGQHFTISRGGFVLEGRRRSLEALRSGHKQVEGAHCTGQNLVSIGIENEGTYTGTGPPGVLWERLREMCAHVCRQYGIAPTEIYGHRDFKDTLCPGDVLHGLLPRLRSEVGSALGQLVEGSSPVVSWPILHVGDSGVVVATVQHLLRAAGQDVAPDGEFGPALDEAVRRFQTEHATEEVNGIVGGESWPLLVRTADAAAIESVVSDGPAPPALDEPTWKALLTAAAP